MASLVKELERLLVSIDDLIEDMSDEELQNFLLTKTCETVELDLMKSIARVQHNRWIDLGRPDRSLEDYPFVYQEEIV